jgi:putative endonuclease
LRINDASSHDLGVKGEDLALRFLEKKKYRIIEKGFRLYRGEIDIIAYDKRTLVFVEVKTRRSHRCGFPEEAVTPAKQKQLKKIALAYCALNEIHDVECRFDVITLLYDNKGKSSLSHIENAF